MYAHKAYERELREHPKDLERWKPLRQTWTDQRLAFLDLLSDSSKCFFFSYSLDSIPLRWAQTPAKRESLVGSLKIWARKDKFRAFLDKLVHLFVQSPSLVRWARRRPRYLVMGLACDDLVPCVQPSTTLSFSPGQPWSLVSESGLGV